jgi:hypothetical protein
MPLPGENDKVGAFVPKYCPVKVTFEVVCPVIHVLGLIPEMMGVLLFKVNGVVKRNGTITQFPALIVRLAVP